MAMRSETDSAVEVEEESAEAESVEAESVEAESAGRTKDCN